MESPFLNVTKAMVALWTTGLASNLTKAAPSSVRIRLNILVPFMRDLHQRGVPSLELVTPDEVQRWVRSRIRRPDGRVVSRRTVCNWTTALSSLHLNRSIMGEGLVHEPFPPQIRKRMLATVPEVGTWQAPPLDVCLALLRGSMHLIGEPADDLIRTMRQFLNSIDTAMSEGRSRRAAQAIARAALDRQRLTSRLANDTQREFPDAPRASELAMLFRRIQAACFIVITYTAGMRVSELRRAGPGSVKRVTHSNGCSYPYYFGPQSKRRTQSLKQPAERHRWILSEAAERAFTVLEKLSEPLRARSNIENYWIAFTGSGLLPTRDPKRGFSILSNIAINSRLNALAKFLKLEESVGWKGRLHSHMGRKALARFVAMRDRRALGDLAVQFAHQSAESVDIGYARPDSEYRRLVGEKLAAELQEMGNRLANQDHRRSFSPSKTAGYDEDGGAHGVVFRGQLRTTKELKRLLGSGASVFPGLWGACVYRHEMSLCGGSRDAPSSARRSPLVCASCCNFVAGEQHAEWWTDYVADAKAFLRVKGVSRQVKAILQKRIDQGESILRRVQKDEGADKL